MKRIVVDVDNTLTIADSSVSYADVRPNLDVISKLRVYNENGFEIVLSTSRNMRSFNCNTGKINAITLPVLIEWLRAHAEIVIPHIRQYLLDPAGGLCVQPRFDQCDFPGFGPVFKKLHTAVFQVYCDV